MTTEVTEKNEDTEKRFGKCRLTKSSQAAKNFRDCGAEDAKGAEEKRRFTTDYADPH